MGAGKGDAMGAGLAATSPVFSIVVPVYQVEEYLACCLDSILAQTYGDLEVICVNDGSTDASREILAAYAGRDSRIRIIDQENRGLSAARNTGIKAARGAYLMFVDSDDSIQGNTCSTLKSAFEDSGAEVVTFGAEVHSDEDIDPWTVIYLSPRDVFYPRFEPALLFEERSQPYVWRTALTRDFLIRTDLLFDETLRFGEDAVFHFLAYPQSRGTLLLSDKLYNYRALRSGSLMAERKGLLFQKIRDHYQIIQRIVTGWDRLGFLGEYGTGFYEWMVDFIVQDTAAQTPEDQAVLLKELGGILTPYLARRELRKLKLMRSTRWILRVILAAPGASAPRIRWSLWEYYRKSCLKKQ